MRTCAPGTELEPPQSSTAGMPARLNSSQLRRHAGSKDCNDQCCRPLLFSYRNSIQGRTGGHVAGASAAYENQAYSPGKFWNFYSINWLWYNAVDCCPFSKAWPTFFVTKNIIYQLLSEIRITVISLCYDTKFKSVVDTTISIFRLNLIQKHLNKWLIFQKKCVRDLRKDFPFPQVADK